MSSENVLPADADTITPVPAGDSRHIRSFIRRQGRITQAQNKALQELWPIFGVLPAQLADTETLFGRSAPLILEIGFGNGESLATMAAQNPDQDYIGIEVHKPGVGHLLLQIGDLGLTNVRVCCADAIEVLNQSIRDASLDRLQLFFPDPWHKKRHNKRRIVNSGFLTLISQKLKPGGIFHAATDWEPYAEQMAFVCETSSEFTSEIPGEVFAPRPAYRPLTKFESRGQRLGHGVWDLIYRRNPI